jgi:hypothetical protein
MSGSKFSPDGIGEEGSVTESDVSPRTEVPTQAHAGVVRTILGRDDVDDDRPLPDLPPLPEDPSWRIEHLPFVTAAGLALVLCTFSAGFLADGLAGALGAAGGGLIVTVGVSLTTLAIAWADVIRPELVLPVGMGVYMVKYAAIVFLLFAVAGSDWSGAPALFWGVAVNAVVLTGVQAWWLTRLAARRAAAVSPPGQDPA